jgi:hypothetical protein
MRVELWILGIAGFLIYDTYHDGKYSKIVLSWKKYYRMAFMAFVAIMVYLLFKRNPTHFKSILLYANNMIRYAPIDKASLSVISPILDFTSGSGYNDDGSYQSKGFMEMLNEDLNPGHNYMAQERRILSSGSVTTASAGKATKRSVSETKKKYVASQQDWKCNGCGQRLNAWFEVDHKVRLEHGGGNEVDNLVALCRECHGKKTAMENL